MFLKARPFFLYTETSLHVGSGSELGVVDLPIQREKHTEFPKIESSSLKGAIREAFEERFRNSEEGKKKISLVFGPENGDEHAGALGFIDARILLFPVRSLKGIFAWITCPAVLNRLVSDFGLCNVKELPPIPSSDKKIPTKCNLVTKGDKVVLEEYTFIVKADAECDQLAEWLSSNVLPPSSNSYWIEKLKKDLVILPDDDFRDFVLMSTEVNARIKIDNDIGTVAEGALFYEEYLPSETVLYSIALASPLFVEDSKKGDLKGDTPHEEANNVMKFFSDNLPQIIQVGGNATIGKGIVRTTIFNRGV